MYKRRIIGVYGVSGFGREVAPLVRNQINLEKELSYKTEIFFIDDSETLNKKFINGHKVLNWDQFLEIKSSLKEICVAIAKNNLREEIVNKISKHDINLFTTYSPSCRILDHVEVGAGSIVTDGCIFTSNIKIGKCFHSNLNSYVGHDCIIGDFVTFAPSVKCNGNIHIGNNVYIGTGAIIKQGKPNKPLLIGEGAKIEAGSYVTKNVEPHSTVFGCPAKKLSLSLLRSMYS